MKKYKSFTILLIIIFMLTGCSLKKETVNTIRTDNSFVITKPSNEEIVVLKPSTDVIKPEATEEAIKETVNIESKATEQVKEINGFVLLSSMDKNLIIDLKYATTDNFTKKVIYPNTICLLRKSTAEKLFIVNCELIKLGFTIKVWDAYRPIYVQQIFWDIVRDSRFVANPKTGGSIHNRGCAVDVTLTDKNDNELTMPSQFDDFSPNAYRNNSKMSNEAKKNMDLLARVMVKNGFKTIDTEWWHFEDIDSEKYKNADIDLNLFLN